MARDAPLGVDHHRPGQLGDLAARRPALTDSRTMTRARSGYRLSATRHKAVVSCCFKSVLACLPAIFSLNDAMSLSIVCYHRLSLLSSL
jgi:hypothetical protein